MTRLPSPLRRAGAVAFAAALLASSPAPAGEDVFTRTVRFHLETGDLIRAEAVVRNLEESGEEPERAAELRRMLEETRGGGPAAPKAAPGEPGKGASSRDGKPPAGKAGPAAPARRAAPAKSGRMRYAEGLLAQGKTREVLLALADLVAGRSPDPHALLLLGKLRFADGKFEEAAALLSGALDSVDDAHASFLAGLCAQRLGRAGEARARFASTLRLDPVSAAPALALGNLERAERRFDEARQAYLEALRRDPSLVPAHLGMADALDALGDEEESVRAYTYVLKAFPTGHDVCYLGLARVLHRKERLDEALKLLAKAAEANPANPQVKAMRASVHLQKGDRKAAEADLREALRLAPGDSASRDRLVDLLLARRALADAKEELKKATRLSPDDGRNHYRLGLIYSGEREFRLAERHFTLALERKHDPVETMIALAILREGENRLMEAQALYDKARQAAEAAGNERYRALLEERVKALGGRIWKKDGSEKPKREKAPESPAPPAEILPGIPLPGLE